MSKRKSASTRIDELRPTSDGMSDAEMGFRAGFRDAREQAAQIASEHDVIAAELLEALQWIAANGPDVGWGVRARALGAIAKAEGK